MKRLRCFLSTLLVIASTVAPMVLFADERVVQHFMQSMNDSNLFLYVSASKHDPSEKKMRLFVGPARSMKAKTIESVRIYLDGGTTIIKTVDGETFYFPRSLGSSTDYPLGGPSPTWNNLPLRDLTSSKFEIVETGDSARIKEE